MTNYKTSTKSARLPALAYRHTQGDEAVTNAPSNVVRLKNYLLALGCAQPLTAIRNVATKPAMASAKQPRRTAITAANLAPE